MTQILSEEVKMTKQSYNEEQMKYLTLKATQLKEKQLILIREEEQKDEHDFNKRGLIGSGLFNARKIDRLVERYRLRLQAYQEATLATWKAFGIKPKPVHLEFLQAGLKERGNHHLWLEAAKGELGRLGQRAQYVEAVMEDMKRKLQVCDIQEMNNAEILFYEQSGTKNRKRKIFISSVQDELEGERSSLKNRINLAFPGLFEIYVFEHETPDSRSPEDFYGDNVLDSDIYIGVFKRQFSESVAREFQKAKERGIITWLFFNIRLRNEEEVALRTFRENTPASYKEWNHIRGLENSVIEAINKHLAPGIKAEAPVTGEKIVDLKWAEEANICEALRKEGYQLHWYKEDKVERKLGEGWIYLETHDESYNKTWRYVTQDRLFLLRKK